MYCAIKFTTHLNSKHVSCLHLIFTSLDQVLGREMCTVFM